MGVSVCFQPGGIGSEHLTFYIPTQHDSWMAPDAQNLTIPPDFLTHVEGELVFHNAKFDIHVLKKLGLDLSKNKIYDTMLMGHLLWEDQLSHSLDHYATIYLGLAKEKQLARIMKKGEWEEMPAFAMAKYAENDVKLTLDLYNHFKPSFSEFEPVWDIDEQFMYLLQEMEQKGLLIDLDFAVQLQTACKVRLAEIEKELGFDPAKPSQLHKRLFDPPPFGYGLKVTKRTKGGKPQVNTAFLEQLNHPVAGLLLEWRQLQKQLTSYCNPYIDLTKGYGRLHASFKQHGTVTGRLSCADPNLQQIPRDSEFKKLFIAEEGKELWEIDFKNIEMRLAAVYSKEPILFDTFKEEGDVHQITATSLGINRHKAKTINFLVIYGGGAGALANQLRLPYSDCDSIIKKYRNLYPALFSTMNAATEAANRSGEVRMWSGRKRHFRYPSEHHKAFNSIIQGGSFEIVKRSMLKLQEAGFDIRNQVHDSVWLMVDSKKDVEEAEHIMSDWTEEAFGLKFSVESKRLN